MARFAALAEWLEWQQRLSPKEIVLGLDRVSTVGARLGLSKPHCPVITVAGTNGKGSVVAMLGAMLSAGGYRVGSYTSPHLLRYNERVRVDGIEADDAMLMGAFEAIDDARSELPLTYFEFGTLAALHVFAAAKVDVMVLEVGLGGRLDAVNIIDPDVAVITTVDLDHAEWLGDDRETIGLEKAGIMREGRPAICGDRHPPSSLLDHAGKIGADLRLFGRDFEVQRCGKGLRWTDRDVTLDLPRPALRGAFQRDNTATALAALRALTDRLPIDTEACAEGLRNVHVAGRYQCLSEQPAIVCDVAHNPQAARALASILREEPVRGRNFAVFSVLAGKDIAGIAGSLDNNVEGWFVGGLDGARGLGAAEIAARMGTVHGSVSEYRDVASALAAARALAGPDDRIVVCGSFLTVAVALSAGL